MTHFFKTNKEKFDSVVAGDNYQVMRFKVLPKAGDKIIHEHASGGEIEQKETVVIETTCCEGLLKGWYLVHHKGEGI